MASQAETIDALLSSVPVMPVLVIEDVAHALPLCDALKAGGINAVEITLRTSAALEAVRTVAAERSDMVIGTGTVLTEADLKASADAGAQFAVSPGLTPSLAEAARPYHECCPLLPGVATASEAMQAAEWGFERLKFFPAEPAGGAPYLGGIKGPLPHLKFCPTGGIKPEKVAGYKAVGNVFTVGGSWLAPKAMLESGDWAGIEALAREAAAL